MLMLILKPLPSASHQSRRLRSVSSFHLGCAFALTATAPAPSLQAVAPQLQANQTHPTETVVMAGST